MSQVGFVPKLTNVQGLYCIVVVNVVGKGGFFWWLWVRTELNYGCIRTYGRPTVVSYQRLGNHDLSVKTALYTPRYVQIGRRSS